MLDNGAITRQRCRVRIETSGGRGRLQGREAITRQRCRVRIETLLPILGNPSGVPITRQRCRVRIETSRERLASLHFAPSPGSDAGCGLKH